MREILYNVRHGLRVLAKSPGLTSVAVLILALGIGASTAIFSILYAEAIRPLPYDHPEQLVTLWRTDPQLPQLTVSGPDFLDWAQQSNVFSGLAAFRHFGPTLAGAGENETISGYRVTPDFFKVLKVRPAEGRLFAAGDDQPGRDHVLVLGHGHKARGAGKALAALGGKLNLDKEDYAAIGSVPATFRFPMVVLGQETDPEFYAPFRMEQLSKNRQDASLFVIARLKPGVTMQQAQAQMTTIAARLAKQYPDSNSGIGVRVASLRSLAMEAPTVLTTMLLIGVGFLLLIACANVAVLLLTRGAGRQREMAIRQAVGASPGRIATQLLTENLLLALAGGALGVLLAFIFKDAWLSWTPAAMISQSNSIQINLPVLAFAVALSMVTGILFGLIPALQTSRVSLEGLMKEGARAGGAGVRSVGFRDFLVVAEVTLALSLLIVCGLMIRAMAEFFLQKPAFNPRNLLTMNLTVADSKYPTFEARYGLWRKLTEQVDTLPGVQSSALEGRTGGHVAASYQPLTSSLFRKCPFAIGSLVSPDYFQTMQLSLLRGRAFNAADYVEKPSVAIVNSTLASRLWPNQNALGKRFTITYPPEWYEVVGVAADSRMILGVAMPQAYLPKVSTRAQMLVRTAGEPKRAMPLIPSRVGAVDKEIHVSSLMTMEDELAQIVAPVHYALTILGSMALAALLLATIGVYAVTAFAVAQRTHEIGVRMALGARRAQVLLFVMRHGIRLSLLGIVIGLLIALGLGRVLSFFLHGVLVGDVSTYLGVSLMLLGVTLLASYLPARRATKVDPVTALRCE